MKIREACAAVSPMMPGADNQGRFIKWLSDLDLTVKNEIIDTHEGAEDHADFAGYDTDTDVGTVLLVPAPYDAIYPLWLEAQIYYTQAEYARYNNALATFKAAYQDYAAYYNRNHMPKGEKIKYTARTGDNRFDPLS